MHFLKMSERKPVFLLPKPWAAISAREEWMPLMLNERLVVEASRLADEIFRRPIDHDRAVALRLVLAGAEMALGHVRESGLVGLPARSGPPTSRRLAGS
jgi:hypothetical protein